MKWFRRTTTPVGDRPLTEENSDLVAARKARELAERKLNEAKIAAAQLKNVAIVARQIRAENQFSLRLAQVFESRPRTNG